MRMNCLPLLLSTSAILAWPAVTFARDKRAPRNGSGQTEATVTSEASFGTWEDGPKNRKVLDGILPCDQFSPKKNISFSINKYAADIVTVDGTPPDPAKKKQFRSHGITNEKALTIRGTKVVFKLIEAHKGDTGSPVRDWFVLEINGYRVRMAREEIRTFTMSNGLRFNLVGPDLDIDFCLKALP